jgi:Holliday junction resolvase RusA-like endonuclease
MITLTVLGQIPSGKNSVIITRTGLRFPAKRFVTWRKDALEQLEPQIAKITLPLPLDEPCNVTVDYVASDMRRRDVPGMIDALWHLLEKANVITDDKYLGGHGANVVFVNRGKDKENTGVTITIDPIKM